MAVAGGGGGNGGSGGSGRRTSGGGWGVVVVLLLLCTNENLCRNLSRCEGAIQHHMQPELCSPVPENSFMFWSEFF